MSNRNEGKETKDIKEGAQKGKGVDIGTVFVKCAYTESDEIIFTSQRNAFFEVEYPGLTLTKRIFDDRKIKYVVKDNKLYVVGNNTLQFASIFNKETRRPLTNGVISPTEEEALPIVELLIKSVVGEPRYQDEVVYFSVPGEPLDTELNLMYHIKTIEGFLKTLGYTPKPINEGLAVILSELADKDFTGIGISFGGGMVNVCVCFMSVPIFKFSVTRAGDWIDQQVAMTVDDAASRISAIKESSLDLSKEKDLSKIENTLSIHYHHLIEYVIENIKQELNKAGGMRGVAKPITIVLSGGTSLPKGFSHRFKQILEQLKLPVSVGEVRMAAQPLSSVAKGALIAARAEGDSL
ncbi:MAG: hypothetical protein A2W05_08580 [Candidatus Schekmanbacteria bacterium RBG_16_38_10]|uniref:SHS2 domain-containing protein n=1 Tax=Candidatus Schekmanbacteria bacterium RBG_16_38_10 TaxID=1817879 RepID=A0A1F7RU19_9BACT|nr:MAG: hypothetical protein A2W05_08580 [Candidatus Schekmanbacteria bacterium RBG_16_38_10]